MAGLYSGRREREIQQQTASVALAIEALETILVEQGVLSDGQLLKKIEELAKQKALNRAMPRFGK